MGGSDDNPNNCRTSGFLVPITRAWTLEKAMMPRQAAQNNMLAWKAGNVGEKYLTEMSWPKNVVLSFSWTPRRVEKPSFPSLPVFQ